MRGRRWRDTAVARASDDFYPRDPASSTPHISACAFLSLFLSPLVQPDWDMFHRCGPCSMSHSPCAIALPSGTSTLLLAAARHQTPNLTTRTSKRCADTPAASTRQRSCTQQRACSAVAASMCLTTQASTTLRCAADPVHTARLHLFNARVWNCFTV